MISSAAVETLGRSDARAAASCRRASATSCMCVQIAISILLNKNELMIEAIARHQHY